MPIGWFRTKKAVEQTPQVAKKEMQWLRGKPGEFFPFARERTRNFVHDLTFGAVDKRFRSRTHTHIYSAGKYGRKKGTPSMGDFGKILEDLDSSNIRNWHIASVSAKGELMGHLSMRASKKLVDAVKSRSEEEVDLFSEIRVYEWNGCPKEKTHEQVDAELFEKFKALGLQVKAVPMPGYVFDGKKFVKK